MAISDTYRRLYISCNVHSLSAGKELNVVKLKVAKGSLTWYICFAIEQCAASKMASLLLLLCGLNLDSTESFCYSLTAVLCFYKAPKLSTEFRGSKSNFKNGVAT